MPPTSVGVAYGRNADINDIIKAAEEEMYKDKQKFYAVYPEMKH